MPDVDLRQLERAAAQGDEQAGVRLLRERLKRGLIDDERIALAAYLGDPGALTLRPDCVAHPNPEYPTEYVQGLARWGRTVVVMALYAMAQARLEQGARKIALLPSDGSGPFPLRARASALVGRGSTCNLRLASSSVSREHCRIWIDALEDIRVKDLGSSNGTWLAGRPLPPDKSVVLHPGDRLQVGSVYLEVSVAGTPGPLTTCLHAIAAWLKLPDHRSFVSVEGALRVLDASAVADPVTRELLLSCARSVCSTPPTGMDDPIPLDPGFEVTIRRALLPVALDRDPLPQAPAPPPIVQSTMPPRDQLATEMIEAGLDMQVLRPFGRRSGDHSGTWLARRAGEPPSRLTLVPDGFPNRKALEHIAELDPPLAHPCIQRVVGIHNGAVSVGFGCLEVEHVGATYRAVPPATNAEAVTVVRGVCPGAIAATAALGPFAIHSRFLARGRDGPVLNAAEAWFSWTSQTIGMFPSPFLGNDPPEAIEDRSTLAAPATVYWLATTLYQLLARRPLFTGERTGEVLRQICRATPAPISGVSSELNAVLGRALAKQPAERYADPLAFEAALAQTPEGAA